MIKVENKEQTDEILRSLVLILGNPLSPVLAPVPHHLLLPPHGKYSTTTIRLPFEGNALWETLLCERLQLDVGRQLFCDAAGRKPQETAKTGEVI